MFALRYDAYVLAIPRVFLTFSGMRVALKPQMLSLRRISAIRLPLTARGYANSNDGPTHSGNPQGFDKRERANEEYYIKQHEKDQLKKLRDEIAKKEQEIGDLKEKAKNLDK